MLCFGFADSARLLPIDMASLGAEVGMLLLQLGIKRVSLPCSGIAQSVDDWISACAWRSIGSRHQTRFGSSLGMPGALAF